jgi:DnaJ-class molecular chaperone
MADKMQRAMQSQQMERTCPACGGKGKAKQANGKMGRCPACRGTGKTTGTYVTK